MNRDDAFHYRLIPLLATGISATRYLELGCAAGECLLRVYRAIASTGVTPVVVGVDKTPAVPDTADMPGLRVIAMSTREFLGADVDAYCPFDLVFIDADHHVDEAWMDFRRVLPHVRDQGLILLHDTYPGSKDRTGLRDCGTVWQVPADYLHTYGSAV